MTTIQQPVSMTAPRFGRLADANERQEIKQTIQTKYPTAQVDDKYCYTLETPNLSSSSAPGGSVFNTVMETFSKIKNFATEISADQKDIAQKLDNESAKTVEVYQLIKIAPDSDLKQYAEIIKSVQSKAAGTSSNANIEMDVFELPPSTLLTRNVIDVEKAKAAKNRSFFDKIKDAITAGFKK